MQSVCANGCGVLLCCLWAAWPYALRCSGQWVRAQAATSLLWCDQFVRLRSMLGWDPVRSALICCCGVFESGLTHACITVFDRRVSSIQFDAMLVAELKCQW
jgi:hypothetical protein